MRLVAEALPRWRSSTGRSRRPGRALIVERDGRTSSIGHLDRFARQAEAVA
jgi:hypothetical protein